jgi:protein-L-isoaspartate O-methyltransferase
MSNDPDGTADRERMLDTIRASFRRTEVETGIAMIPVDRAPGQMLSILRKRANGGVERHDVLPVAFVPMVRGREQG